MELLTPEPVYITSSRYAITVRAFIVNSFGKTVRASQSHLAVTVVNGTDRSNATIQSYLQSGELSSVLSRNLDIQTEFGNSGTNDTFVEISLTSAANFITTISNSPVYAGKYFEFICMWLYTSILLLEITNITLIGNQSILATEQLILNCFTVPSDLPVVWFVISRIDSPDRQLAEDPRVVIESTEYGSRLTLTNTTVEDTQEYGCRFNQREAFALATTFVTIIPGTYLCLSIFMCVSLST